MKPLPLLALIPLLGLSSCDKVRNLASELGKKPAAGAAAAAAFPKGLGELLPAKTNRIVIVDFYADWCGPCRQLSPILEKIGDEHANSLTVCKVNVDQFRELSAQEKVSSIPDVRIYQDGKLVDQFVGAPPESAVRKRIDKWLANLPPAPAAAPQAGAVAAPPKPKEPPIRPMPKNWLPEGIQRR